MSLQGYLDENITINSIRLQLRHPSGKKKIWIIVEGETDQKLYSKLIDADHVEIEISHGGLSSLLKTVYRLAEETNRVIGIRDTDFLHLEEDMDNIDNIFLTDFHDAEMMIVSCDNACKQVFAEFLTEEKNPAAVREKLLLSIKFISGVRWLNDLLKLELNFKGFSFGNFYDGRTILLNENDCLTEIIKRSPNMKSEITHEQVYMKIKEVSNLFDLCNGHDFCKIFAIYVNSRLKKGKKEINDIRVSEAFRISYRFDDFKKTNLYKKLKGWANNQAITLFTD